MFCDETEVYLAYEEEKVSFAEGIEAEVSIITSEELFLSAIAVSLLIVIFFD